MDDENRKKAKKSSAGFAVLYRLDLKSRRPDRVTTTCA
jgi:hypothetical protein